MGIIHERIKERRLAAGKTLLQAANILGVKEATAQRYESGAIKNIKVDAIATLAEFFRCDPSYLAGWKDDPAPSKQPAPEGELSDGAMNLAKDYDGLDGHGQRMIRLVADEEKVRCTEQARNTAKEGSKPEKAIYIVPYFPQPMSAGTGIEAGDEYPEELELTRRPPRGTSYVAPVSGNSMEPTYHEGDKLFIRSCDEIVVGQIGVFLMNGKQWVKELGVGELLSHNTGYDPNTITEDTRCQGLVLGVCDASYFK